MNPNPIIRIVCIAMAAVTALAADLPPNGTLLFQNLRTLSSSFRVDNPAVNTAVQDGPKGLAVGDLDGDGRNDMVVGNTDGTVAVLFGGVGGGFEPVIHLPAGSGLSPLGEAGGLRDVIIANVKGDARPEIIAAHPFDEKLYIFSVQGGAGSRSFSPRQEVPTWLGARSVAAGDFDGDGNGDLVVAGAGLAVPAADGTRSSVREFRGDGQGGFLPMTPIAEVDAGIFRGNAQPVVTMHGWRHPTETRDRLVVTFAGASFVWFLQSPAVGQPLAVAFKVTLPAATYGGITYPEAVYDLALGYISPQSRLSGEPDLLTAAQDNGLVSLRRYEGGGVPYPTTPHQQLTVPGGPRGISVADVNNDTWSDLLVASRNGNSVYLFLNNAGVLSLASQAPAGASPRDVVTADFDGNGLPDAAVINRDSQDITVHRIDPATGHFLTSPLLQPNPGGAAAVTIRDLNGDGRGELLYLNPTTGDASIQKFSLSGLLLPAVQYSMGVRPQTLSVTDINGDGLPDLESSSIGTGAADGGLKYRLQLPDGTFGPLTDVLPPALAGSPMLGEIVADFNGDGIADRAALFYDCRIALFEGTSTGLVHRRTEMFTYESRAIASLDLDQDGDLDLVGAGAYGDVVIVENNGQWFTGGPYVRTELPSSPSAAGAYLVSSDDFTGDGDPDLTVFSKTGVARWIGGAGLTFTPGPGASLPNTFDQTARDFDGDGIVDYFAIRPSEVTASFFKGTAAANGQWWTLLPERFSVPPISKLATGDIDGDGLPDLVGIGEYLWVALSGTPAPALVPTAVPPATNQVTTVVINEILASTTSYVAPGTSAPSDAVEIFNGSSSAVDLTNWKLRRVDLPDADFTFPPAFTLPPNARTVVYCTGWEIDTWDAPFKLPEEGATLLLLNAAGAEVDVLTFGPQQPDVSYSRLSDASRTLVYNPLPSIGTMNSDNGNADVVVSFKNVDFDLLKSGTWRFRAQAWSASGMFTLTVHWREITASPNPRSGSIPLYDDSMHYDGASLDGVFAGDWDTPVPRGTAIEFYITGTDLRGESITKPGGQQFSAPGQPITNYTLVNPVTPVEWEISEVVTRNEKSIQGEPGIPESWVEIRYTGADEAPVENLFLSDSLFGYDIAELYDVSRQGTTVSPGTILIVFPDGGTGARHAPFKIEPDGDTIYLLRRLPSGATELVDWVKVPALKKNVAYARLGTGGAFVQDTTPTPGVRNGPLDDTLNFPSIMTVEATNPAGAVVTYTPTAQYPGVQFSGVPASGSTFPFGTTPVTVTASDGAGLTRTGTFTVTVRDTTAPALTLPANMTLEATSPAGAVATFATKASDAVDAAPVVIANPASGSTFAPGTTTVNVTTTDASGNSSNGTFTVTVRDTTAPTLTILGSNPASVFEGVTYTDARATALDAASGNLTASIVQTGTVDTAVLGSYAITYSVTDAAGFTTQAVRIVNVVPDPATDHAPPTLNVSSPKPGHKTTGASVTFSGNAADDTRIARVEVAINGGAPQIVTPPVPGGYFQWELSTLPENGLNTATVTAFDQFEKASVPISLSFTFVNLRPQFAGNYNGRFEATPDSPTPIEHEGLVAISVLPTGAFTGKVTMAGRAFPFTGTLLNDGTARFGKAATPSITLLKPGSVLLGQLALTLDTASGAERIGGTLTQDTSIVATLAHADRALYTARGNPVSPLMNVPAALADPLGNKGRYTAIFRAGAAPNNGSPADGFPQGHGWVRMSLAPTGRVTLVGRLADDSRVGYANALSKTNELPVFVPLYGNKGFISGRVTFDPAQAVTDARDAAMKWFKPANASDRLYPGGWPGGITTDFSASKFVLPARPTARNPEPLYITGTHNILGLVGAPASAAITLTLQDGGTPGFSNDATVDAASRITIGTASAGEIGASKLKAVADPGTGRLEGSFTHPGNNKEEIFKGIIFQKTHAAGGYFIYLPPKPPGLPAPSGHSGTVEITP